MQIVIGCYSGIKLLESEDNYIVLFVSESEFSVVTYCAYLLGFWLSTNKLAIFADKI